MERMVNRSTDVPNGRPRVRLETHGCKLNQADSQVLATELAKAGYEIVVNGPADVFVLNTCTVTHVADRKARGAVRAYRRRNPDGLVVVTGCYAQRAPDEIRAMREVDLAIGNADKPALVDMISEAFAAPATACAVGSDESLAPALKLRSRAMIKIQEGCDQVCAFCIVPKVRGRERSVPLNEIVDTANAYEEAGCREVVLTGTQLGSYGFDLDGADITILLEALLSGTGLPRIRVSSLQPQDLSDDLLELWEDSRLCPHFHVPLQSGSDQILKRMRRRYTSAEFENAVEKIREAVPGVSVTADAIVGFPGETELDFDETVGTCQSAGLASVHVFPYSVRPGTSAAHYEEQVAPTVKSRRVRVLSESTDSEARRFREGSIGETRPVLWEREVFDGNSGSWTGLTDNYLRVRTRSDSELSGRITLARLESLEDEVLDAKVVGPAF